MRKPPKQILKKHMGKKQKTNEKTMRRKPTNKKKEK